MRNYLCDWAGCGKSFVTGTRLRRHRAAHEGKEPFRCDIEACGQVFRKHGTLQKHITVVHEGKSLFVCKVLNRQGEECGAGFDTAGQLKSHEGRDHGDKRFWCTMCSSASSTRERDFDQEGAEHGFSTYTELLAHIDIEHAPTCEACGLQCKSQRALKSHLDIVHGPLGVDERRKYACGEPGCGRAFTKKGNLNVHVRTTHGQKRFICGSVDLSCLKNIADWDGSNACGQALSTKQSLEGHIRAVHLGLSHSWRNADNLITERKKPRSKPIPTLVRLTGAGYDNESGRDISCLMPNCKYRFMRNYDLEVHLSFHHGLSSHELESRWTERENLVPRWTWDGSMGLTSREELEIDHALDMQCAMEGIQKTLPEGHVERSDSGVEQLKKANVDGCQGYQDQEVDMIDPILR